ncbi:MAG: hypothetical protein JEZ11_07100 [Desulfobacterales bacterium]|nr:hypothetical protein [Desulfobacterales bacterium]
MGGFGSGSWFRLSSKGTTESQHRIDIRVLKRWGHVKPGEFSSGVWLWSRKGKSTGMVVYCVNSDESMVLNYRHRPRGGEWETVEQRIHFAKAPCNYGGYRLWFICPKCTRRVAVLYGAGKYFLCRHCYGLAYTSQQESLQYRMLGKARNIRKRLSRGNTVFDLFPMKPKGMHWKTYDRLRDEARRASAIGWGILGRRFNL